MRVFKCAGLSCCWSLGWPVIGSLVLVLVVGLTHAQTDDICITFLAEQLKSQCTENGTSRNVSLQHLAAQALLCYSNNITRPLSFLVPDGSAYQYLHSRAAAFAALTGFEVQLQLAPIVSIPEQAAYDIQQHPLQRDGWIFDGSALAMLGQYNGLESLEPLVAADAALQAHDWYPFWADVSARYGGSQLSLPISSDILLLYYRADLMQAMQLAVPRTWEEMLNVASAAEAEGNGSATSNSSSRVHGLCLNTGCSPSYIFSAIAASILQYNGTGQGWYIDPSSGMPLMSTVASESALNTLHRMLALSPPQPQGQCGDPVAAFAAGQCLMTINWIGQLKAAVAGPIRGHLGVAALPGSQLVLERQALQLVDCTQTPTLCPYASPEPANGNTSILVNRSPFAARGGLFGSINAHGLGQYQQAGYQFLAFLAGPLSSTQGATNASTDVGPTRFSQLYPQASTLWTSQGFDASDVAQFLTAERDAFQHANIALDMRLPQAAQLRSIIDSCIQNMTNIGWSAATAATAIQEQWQALLALSYPNPQGFSQVYLKTLGQQPVVPSRPPMPPPMPDSSSSDNKNQISDAGIILAVVLPVLAVVCALIVWAEYRHRHSKGRTLFGHVKAPKVGEETTLVVTDIENSTLLWELLPSEAMDLAVSLHHSCVRRMLLRYSGYESCTEGDSFILAFHAASHAVNFCAATQDALLHLKWPEVLLKTEQAGLVYMTKSEVPSKGGMLALGQAKVPAYLRLNGIVQEDADGATAPKLQPNPSPSGPMSSSGQMELQNRNVNPEYLMSDGNLAFMEYSTALADSRNMSRSATFHRERTGEGIETLVEEDSSEICTLQNATAPTVPTAQPPCPQSPLRVSEPPRLPTINSPSGNGGIATEFGQAVSTSPTSKVNMPPSPTGSGNGQPPSVHAFVKQSSRRLHSVFASMPGIAILQDPEADAKDAVATNSFTNLGTGSVVSAHQTVAESLNNKWKEVHPDHPAAIVVFRGLRVRMGIHSGIQSAHDVQHNRASGRMQYGGFSLSMTKALCDAGCGGMVLMGPATIEQLAVEKLKETVMVLHMGEHLVHVGAPALPIYQAIRKSLIGRIPMMCQIRSILQHSLGVLQAPAGMVTVVFMHVVGERTLLDWNPAVASAALQLFQDAVSSQLLRFQGYLVECVNGFVLASFSNPLSAIQWAVECSQVMNTLPWPGELLEHELCEELAVSGTDEATGSRTEVLLFRGLRLKCGLDCGKLRGEINCITGRMTYRGKYMNRAARIAAAAGSRQVLASSDVLSSCNAAAVQLYADVYSMGMYRLKGINEPIEVFNIKPQHDVLHTKRADRVLNRDNDDCLDHDHEQHGLEHHAGYASSIGRASVISQTSYMHSFNQTLSSINGFPRMMDRGVATPGSSRRSSMYSMGRTSNSGGLTGMPSYINHSSDAFSVIMPTMQGLCHVTGPEAMTLSAAHNSPDSNSVISPYTGNASGSGDGEVTGGSTLLLVPAILGTSNGDTAISRQLTGASTAESSRAANGPASTSTNGSEAAFGQQAGLNWGLGPSRLPHGKALSATSSQYQVFTTPPRMLSKNYRNRNVSWNQQRFASYNNNNHNNSNATAAAASPQQRRHKSLLLLASDQHGTFNLEHAHMAANRAAVASGSGLGSSDVRGGSSTAPPSVVGTKCMPSPRTSHAGSAATATAAAGSGAANPGAATAGAPAAATPAAPAAAIPLGAAPPGSGAAAAASLRSWPPHLGRLSPMKELQPQPQPRVTYHTPFAGPARSSASFTRNTRHSLQISGPPNQLAMVCSSTTDSGSLQNAALAAANSSDGGRTTRNSSSGAHTGAAPALPRNRRRSGLFSSPSIAQHDSGNMHMLHVNDGDEEDWREVGAGAGTRVGAANGEQPVRASQGSSSLLGSMRSTLVHSLSVFATDGPVGIRRSHTGFDTSTSSVSGVLTMLPTSSHHPPSSIVHRTSSKDHNNLQVPPALDP